MGSALTSLTLLVLHPTLEETSISLALGHQLAMDQGTPGSTLDLKVILHRELPSIAIKPGQTLRKFGGSSSFFRAQGFSLDLARGQ